MMYRAINLVPEVAENEVWKCRKCKTVLEFPPTKEVAPFCLNCAAIASFGKNLPLTFNNEEAGKIVRQVWIDYVKREMGDTAEKKPSWVHPWEKCPEHVREVDRRIADTLMSMYMVFFQNTGISEILEAVMLYKAACSNLAPLDQKDAFNNLLAVIEAFNLDADHFKKTYNPSSPS